MSAHDIAQASESLLEVVAPDQAADPGLHGKFAQEVIHYLEHEWDEYVSRYRDAATKVFKKGPGLAVAQVDQLYVVQADYLINVALHALRLKTLEQVRGLPAQNLLDAIGNTAAEIAPKKVADDASRAIAKIQQSHPDMAQLVGIVGHDWKVRSAKVDHTFQGKAERVDVTRHKIGFRVRFHLEVEGATRTAMVERIARRSMGPHGLRR